MTAIKAKYRSDTIVQDSTLVGPAIPTQNADKTGTRPMGSDFGEMSIVDFLSSQVGNLDQNVPRLFGLYPNGLFTFGRSPVPSGYPNPTRYPVFLSIPDRIQF